MNFRARSLILVVLGLIVIFSSSKTTQARNQGQSLEYPSPAVTTSDITGNWIGFLTQPGRLFSFELSLTQNGSNIQGTSTIRSIDGYYATLTLSGTISGNNILLNEMQIIDSTLPPNWRWCIKSMDLTISSFQSISMLAGNWQDPGCSSGIVQLQRSTDPFIQVGGSWLGTLTQSGTNFSFELDLTQNESNITGTSTIRSGSGYGIMQLVGFLAGNSLVLHETSIIDSNRSNWCIKILNITYTNTGSAVDLNGTWSAPGCTGGSLSVQKQLPAVTYSISGKVTDENGSALSGVTMSTNSGINTVTNLSGVYTFTSLIASTYVLTPIKSGYHFTPNSQVVDVPPDAIGRDFVGTPVYTISGRVTDENLDPLPGVTISAGPGISSTTDPTSGVYTITGLVPGTYILTPTNIGLIPFSPVTRTVNIPPDATKQDFTMPFLDLPIPYTHTTFGTVVQGSFYTDTTGKGRINSWFDHNIPTYNRNGNMYRWDGAVFFGTETDVENCGPGLGKYCYDGHPALDFSRRYDDRTRDELIVAAAPGTVVYTKTDCIEDSTTCGQYLGNQVWIDHGNGYATVYGHLEQNSITVAVSQTLVALTPLGLMGNTGNSDGKHLHFGLYFDKSEARKWVTSDGAKLATTIAVDPFGFWKSVQAPRDPWVSVEGVNSSYLWKYPLMSTPPINTSGGSATSPSGLVNVSVPPLALNSQSNMAVWDVPPAALSPDPRRSAGSSFWIRVWQAIAGSSIYQNTATINDFSAPVILDVNYGNAMVRHLDTSQLVIYRWDGLNTSWVALPTNVDTNQKSANTQTLVAGKFDLQAPLLCPSDSNEVNDDYQTANEISPGIPTTFLFDVAEDEDWFRFDATTEFTYTIQTTNLASGVDTVIELYDLDRGPLLASDDDGGDGAASLLKWQAPVDGVYFIRIVQASGSVYGCGASYELSVRESVGTNVYLPIIIK